METKIARCSQLGFLRSMARSCVVGVGDARWTGGASAAMLASESSACGRSGGTLEARGARRVSPKARTGDPWKNEEGLISGGSNGGGPGGATDTRGSITEGPSEGACGGRWAAGSKGGTNRARCGAERGATGGARSAGGAAGRGRWGRAILGGGGGGSSGRSCPLRSMRQWLMSWCCARRFTSRSRRSSSVNGRFFFRGAPSAAAG